MPKTYSFWNNKGGTGKTTLCFQSLCRYAELHEDEKVLAIDVCPQANLSELLLGGLTKKGADLLSKIQTESDYRMSLGGYFQSRMTNPFSEVDVSPEDYFCIPSQHNKEIPANITLICGDPILELQSNAIYSLSNTQIPGVDSWMGIVNWLDDLIAKTEGEFGTIFLDLNPSFSIFTQMSLRASNYLILPVMADDSSRRAIQNALSLIYGLNLPDPLYEQYTFFSRMQKASVALPQIHTIVKNRLTQYMGAASAYSAVLSAIDNEIQTHIDSSESVSYFRNTSAADIVKEVRDFQTTGVVAAAGGLPFSKVASKTYTIEGQSVQVKREYLQNCLDNIDTLVRDL